MCDGWSPHDGEGKIGSCPEPGCDCDEQNYGHVSGGHRKNSNNDWYYYLYCGMYVKLL